MTKIPINTWRQANLPTKDMFFHNSFFDQIEKIKYQICPLVNQSNDCSVVSTYRSKSVTLPVYEIEGPNIKFILRNNFYDWKVSVISEKPIATNFDGLFYTSPPVDPDYTGNELSSCYFEGFEESWIFGYYDTSDKKTFSFSCSNDSLYTAIYLIMKDLGIVKPKSWSRRPLLDVSLNHAEQNQTLL